MKTHVEDGTSFDAMVDRRTVLLGHLLRRLQHPLSESDVKQAVLMAHMGALTLEDEVLKMLKDLR